MSHMFQLTDEQYETLEQAAEALGETPDALLAAWIDELRHHNHSLRYYETDEWFRHLGATEEQIAEAKRIARDRSDVNT